MGLCLTNGINDLCDTFTDAIDCLKSFQIQSLYRNITPVKHIDYGLIASDFEWIFIMKLHELDDQLKLFGDFFLVQN